MSCHRLLILFVRAETDSKEIEFYPAREGRAVVVGTLNDIGSTDIDIDEWPQ